jgi:hypothetical protein
MELPASINATMRSAACRYMSLVICYIVFLAGAAGLCGCGSAFAALTESGADSPAGASDGFGAMDLVLDALAFDGFAALALVFLGISGWPDSALAASASLFAFSMWFSFGMG